MVQDCSIFTHVKTGHCLLNYTCVWNISGHKMTRKFALKYISRWYFLSSKDTNFGRLRRVSFSLREKAMLKENNANRWPMSYQLLWPITPSKGQGDQLFHKHVYSFKERKERCKLCKKCGKIRRIFHSNNFINWRLTTDVVCLISAEFTRQQAHKENTGKIRI